jgi:GDP-4-dehydro-6-deoxy-D-mannose reductase
MRFPRRWFYSNQFNIPITILRPFNVYGPGQKDSFLIPSIIKQVLSGSDIIEVKTLEPRRDYIYVDDIVTMIIKVFELNSFNIFNVGTGISFSVEEVIQKIQQLAGTSLKVVASGDKRQEEVMDTRADMTKAKELLQWQPEWTLDNGLTEVLRQARMDQLI